MSYYNRIYLRLQSEAYKKYQQKVHRAAARLMCPYDLMDAATGDHILVWKSINSIGPKWDMMWTSLVDMCFKLDEEHDIEDPQGDKLGYCLVRIGENTGDILVGSNDEGVEFDVVVNVRMPWDV